jgi:hypothetical protein
LILMLNSLSNLGKQVVPQCNPARKASVESVSVVLTSKPPIPLLYLC